MDDLVRKNVVLCLLDRVSKSAKEEEPSTPKSERLSERSTQGVAPTCQGEKAKASPK